MLLDKVYRKIAAEYLSKVPVRFKRIGEACLVTKNTESFHIYPKQNNDYWVAVPNIFTFSETTGQFLSSYYDDVITENKINVGLKKSNILIFKSMSYAYSKIIEYRNKK